MQSPAQTYPESNPVTSTAERLLNTEDQPRLEDPQEEDKSAPADAITTPEKSQTGLQAAETPASMAVTPPVETETGVESQTGTMDRESTAKPSAPAEPAPDVRANPGCDGQKVKKQGKGEGKKYVLSKKAMVDPLKMDMSKPLVMPLTCEYFTFYSK